MGEATFGGEMSRGAGLVCESLGDGPTVLLVHAPQPAGGRDEWAELAPRLAAAGYRVVAGDLPGFGDQPAEPRLYRAAEMIEAVTTLLRETAREPVHLVARGYAVAYAVEAAARMPGAVASLVAILPRGLDEPAFDPALYERYAHPLLGPPRLLAATSGPVIAQRLRDRAWFDPTRVTRDLVRAHRRRLRKPGGRHLLASLAAGALRHDVRQAWCDLAVPCLLLWGEACDDPPLAEAERWLMPLRPGAPFFMLDGRPSGVWKTSVTYRTIPDTRQLPHREAAEQTAQAVLAHLSS